MRNGNAFSGQFWGGLQNRLNEYQKLGPRNWPENCPNGGTVGAKRAKWTQLVLDLANGIFHPIMRT